MLGSSRRPKPAKTLTLTGSAAAGVEASDVNGYEAEHSEEDDFCSEPASSKAAGGAGRWGGGGERVEPRKGGVDARRPSSEVNGTEGSAPAAYGFDDEFPTPGGAAKRGYAREDENEAVGVTKRLSLVRGRCFAYLRL